MSRAPRVLHLGLGRFHRGHQAVYFHALNKISNEPWLISAWSMRTPREAEQLKARGFAYDVIQTDIAGSEVTTITAIIETGFVERERELLQRRFSSPEIAWITLTITEKGYCLGTDGRLDLTRPDLDHSAIAVLAAGLEARFSAGAFPVTILSCDNLASNGTKLKAALLAFLGFHKKTKLAIWVDEKISFPNSMVDRIVPSTEGSAIETEKFSEWIIENSFSSAIPDLQKVGVRLVKKIEPFEKRKLSLLNATHSYLAYAGILRGHTYVYEAIGDPTLQKIVSKLHAEVIALTKEADLDLPAYCQSLIKRFANPHIKHRLHQIAMDGSQKLPQRVFPNLQLAMEQGLECDALWEILAAWLIFVWKGFGSQSKWAIDDPWQASLKACYDKDYRVFVPRVLSLYKPNFKTLEPLLHLCEKYNL